MPPSSRFKYRSQAKLFLAFLSSIEYATDTEVKGHLLDQLATVEGVSSPGLISRMMGTNIRAYEQSINRGRNDPLTEDQLEVHKRGIAATKRVWQRLNELASLMLERETGTSSLLSFDLHQSLSAHTEIVFHRAPETMGRA